MKSPETFLIRYLLCYGVSSAMLIVGIVVSQQGWLQTNLSLGMGHEALLDSITKPLLAARAFTHQ